MIEKPFKVDGNTVSGKLLKSVNENGLSIRCVRRRVLLLHWPLAKACTMPKQGTVKKRRAEQGYALKIESKSPVKTYHIPLEDVWEKYGKPGEILRPERQIKKEPMKW